VSLNHKKMAHLPLVYIIILSFNGARYLEGCLSSLVENDYPNIKVLLVDNHSADDSVALVSKTFPHVQVIENEQNYGFAEGMNIGIRHALAGNADYILLVNQDTRFARGCLRELVAVACSSPRLGLVVPVQYEYGGKSLNSVFQSWLKKYFGPGETDLARLRTQPFYEVQDVSGAALLISRRALEVVGFFDPIYFAYSEESDLCRRLIFHGFRIALCTRASFWHETMMTPWKRLLVDRSRLIFSLKDPNKIFLINIINSLILFLWFLGKGIWHKNITTIMFMLLSFYDISKYLKSIFERIKLERKGYKYLATVSDKHYNLVSISKFIGKVH
jgi:GT2 family glycosyltransferase